MTARPEKSKVLCYIVRDGRLLVFRHADQPWDESGLQVPGEDHYDMAPYRDEVQHRRVMLLALDAPAPERWFSQEEDPDEGSEVHRFECYWIPLAQGHTLSVGQGALLGQI